MTMMNDQEDKSEERWEASTASREEESFVVINTGSLVPGTVGGLSKEILSSCADVCS